MIADFYGLPGSGKTTLVRALSQETDSRILGPRHGRSIPKSAHLRNMLRPEFWGFVLKCRKLYRAKKTVDLKTDRMHLGALRRVYLICMWEREQKGEYHCFDGIIQYISSLLWTQYDLEEQALALVQYYLAHMQGGLKTVYTRNDDPEEIYNRIVARGEFRRIQSNMSREQALELMRFQMAFFEKVWQMSSRMEMGAMVSTALPLEESTAAAREALRI